MFFIVNKNAQIKTGEHKIHTRDCKRKPEDKNVLELGEFLDPIVARAEAAKYFSCINGCKKCCEKIYLKR